MILRALLTIGLGLAAPATAEPAPGLDALIERFAAGQPAREAAVSLDAWVEDSGAGREVVLVLEPRGGAKLVADPGITVTPGAQPGVAWQTALPLRHVDPARDYFGTAATIRMPFTADHDHPLELQVEYAYCLVDEICLFGEETLHVATAAP